jgi:phosphoribosylformimino-5-aminoimidazole carboxamide ribotide isomerase
VVDLEGAKTGKTPNLEIVKKIAESTSLFLEIGGGIRDMETVKTYLENGADRVILGTSAVNDEDFLKEVGVKIAVGNADESWGKIHTADSGTGGRQQ